MLLGFFCGSAQATRSIDTNIATYPGLVPGAPVYGCPQETLTLASQTPAVQAFVTRIERDSATLTRKTHQLSHDIVDGLLDAFYQDTQEGIEANVNTFFGRIISKVLTCLGPAKVIDSYGPKKSNKDETAFPPAVFHVLANLRQAHAFAASLLDTYQDLRQEYDEYDTSVREACRLREVNNWKQYAIFSGCDICALARFNFTAMWWRPCDQARQTAEAVRASVAAIDAERSRLERMLRSIQKISSRLQFMVHPISKEKTGRDRTREMLIIVRELWCENLATGKD